MGFWERLTDRCSANWREPIHPLPVPVEERDKEERPPEDEVGHRDHEEHLDPGDPLPLHPLNVHPDPVSWRQSPLLTQTVFVGEHVCFL